MSSLPPESASSQDSPVSGSTPAAVTDHSSYELGVLAGREQAAQIVEGWVDRHTFANSAQIELARHLATAIRSGK